MIRAAWLRARGQSGAAAAGLFAVALVALVTGPRLAHLYSTTVGAAGAGSDVAREFTRTDRPLALALNAVVLVVPALVGLFWGAPLVASELESGTYRLAWTQSVSRTRWLAARLAVVGGTTALAAGLVSLTVSWWAAPLDRARDAPFATFDSRGIVPIGYALFAFALAVALGALLRSALPAIVTGLVAFVAVRLCANHWLRPRYLAPLHRSLPLDPNSTGYGSSGNALFGIPPSTLQPEAPDIPRAWITSVSVLDRSGARLDGTTLASTCPDLVANAHSGPPAGVKAGPVPADAVATMRGCVERVGVRYHEAVSYQPGRRYWAFQGMELGVYLVAAGLAVGFCFWLVRRRLV